MGKFYKLFPSHTPVSSPNYTQQVTKKEEGEKEEGEEGGGRGGQKSKIAVGKRKVIKTEKGNGWGEYDKNILYTHTYVYLCVWKAS